MLPIYAKADDVDGRDAGEWLLLADGHNKIVKYFFFPRLSTRCC